MQAHAHTCMHTYTHIHTHTHIYIYIYIYIYIFLRSTPLDSLAEQPAVAPTFLRPQRGSRAQIASKLLSIFTSPTGHPDGGGAHRHMPTTAPSVRQCDRTHQMRKLPSPKFKSLRSDRRAGHHREAGSVRLLSAERPRSTDPTVGSGNGAALGLARGRLAGSCRTHPTAGAALGPRTCRYQDRRFFLGFGAGAAGFRICSHHSRSTSLTTRWSQVGHPSRGVDLPLLAGDDCNRVEQAASPSGSPDKSGICRGYDRRLYRVA